LRREEGRRKQEKEDLERLDLDILQDWTSD
jgi:hypothetical protein